MKTWEWPGDEATLIVYKHTGPAKSMNGDQKQVGMGDFLSSKLNTLESRCHASGSIAFCRIRLLRVPEGATADGEGHGFDRAGEKMEGGVNSAHKQVKPHGCFLKYTYLLTSLHNRLS